MNTAEIDKIVYDMTTEMGGIPAPLNYEGYPYSVCLLYTSSGFGVNQPLVSGFVPEIAVNDRACEVLAGRCV